MPRYTTNWADYRLSSGQEFGVAVCGYSGKVRHMTIGPDPLRRSSIKFVDVDNSECASAEHCLAVSCSLNRTQPTSIAHMLDMPTDEATDEETGKIWGTDSTVDAMVKLTEKITDILPEEFKKGGQLMTADDSKDIGATQ